MDVTAGRSGSIRPALAKADALWHPLAP